MLNKDDFSVFEVFRIFCKKKRLSMTALSQASGQDKKEGISRRLSLKDGGR